MARWHPELTLTPAFIAAHDVYAAGLDGEWVGCSGLVETDEPAVLELDHLWVWPSAMGQGIGRCLFEEAAARAAERGARRLPIVADLNAVGFYRRMVARPAGAFTYALDGTTRSLPVMMFHLPF